MKYLVYCILDGREAQRDKCPEGIEGRRVSLVVENGLAAAYSLVPDTYASAGMPRVLEYARVIEAFHKNNTVLPMRYGCLFESEEEITDFLWRHRLEFEELLAEFKGCVEMGVRILLGQADQHTPAALYHTNNLSSGASYLANRKTMYAERDIGHEEAATIIEMVQQVFEGLFIQYHDHVDDSTAGGNRLISVYFLIQRSHIEDFRKRFSRFQQDSRQKLLLTGPWPPYNFVSAKKVGQMV